MTRFLCVFAALLSGALADIQGCVVHSDGTSTCSQEAAGDDATSVQHEGTTKLDDENDGSMLSLMQKKMKMTRGIKREEKGQEIEDGNNLGSNAVDAKQEDIPTGDVTSLLQRLNLKQNEVGLPLQKEPRIVGDTCESLPNGCCPGTDKPAPGPGRGEGCEEEPRIVGDTCESLPNGCCPGTDKPAPGPGRGEGCEEEPRIVGDTCESLPNGCCPGTDKPAPGPGRGKGCEEEPRIVGDTCESLPSGCCPGTDKPAPGPGRGEGCEEEPRIVGDTCESLPNGCCPEHSWHPDKPAPGPNKPKNTGCYYYDLE